MPGMGSGSSIITQRMCIPIAVIAVTQRMCTPIAVIQCSCNTEEVQTYVLGATEEKCCNFLNPPAKDCY